MQLCVFVYRKKLTLINSPHLLFKQNVWRIFPQNYGVLNNLSTLFIADFIEYAMHQGIILLLFFFWEIRRRGPNCSFIILQGLLSCHFLYSNVEMKLVNWKDWTLSVYFNCFHIDVVLTWNCLSCYFHLPC